VMCSIFTL